jgi:hypothetical protein
LGREAERSLNGYIGYVRRQEQGRADYGSHLPANAPDLPYPDFIPPAEPFLA